MVRRIAPASAAMAANLRRKTRLAGFSVVRVDRGIVFDQEFFVYGCLNEELRIARKVKACDKIFEAHVVGYVVGIFIANAFRSKVRQILLALPVEATLNGQFHGPHQIGFQGLLAHRRADFFIFDIFFNLAEFSHHAFFLPGPDDRGKE